MIVQVADSLNEQLVEGVLRIRNDIVNMCACPEGGHFGGSMSIVEILACLYLHVMRGDPSNPTWKQRDIFILSKGHGGIALYATLAEAGYIPRSQLEEYAKPGSCMTAHPHPAIPGVESPTGSLGHGLALAVGYASAHKLTGEADRRCYVLMGDGELQEGSVWEAAAVAAAQELKNIVAIIDRNRLQICGGTEEISLLEPLADRWKAFGWNVREVDGHNLHDLVHALVPVRSSSRPTVVIAHTVKGKGAPAVSDRPRSHFAKLGEHQRRRVLASVRRSFEDGV